MHKNFCGYQNGNVETIYTVEYIDDPETWEQFLSVTGNGYGGNLPGWNNPHMVMRSRFKQFFT